MGMFPKLPEPPQITALSDIVALQSWGKILTSYHKVKIAIPGLDSARAQKWEAAINEQIPACGCREGKIAVVASLAAYVLGAFFIKGWATRHIVWTGLIVLWLSASTGKLLGMAMARQRLRVLVRNILSDFAQF
jgi:hypothetical protein